MVYRVYVEKKPGLDVEAQALAQELRTTMRVENLRALRLLNRYDVQGIDRALFDRCVGAVFSEPQLDNVYFDLPAFDGMVLAVEPLPGQFDQRADSAAQCIQILSCAERPAVCTAKVYLLEGALTEAECATVRRHLINPVECREAALAERETLEMPYEAPEAVRTLDGFRQLDGDGLQAMLQQYGLAMDLADLAFCQQYFRTEQRDPTMTELRVLDTYWSDHCRHTTFHTIIDSVSFDDPLLEAAWNDYLATRQELGRTKPVTLMDVGTLAARYLKATGRLEGLDESEEINACTVKITPVMDGKQEDWLLLFKNETHNHPTEIEPFGGAATCIGGAIRDPLSGRSWVYSAMRVTGAADPTVPVSETLPGKLPQRTIVTKAAAGYSSYGNQIGLATGIVDELYHPGYAAKRMEIGAVVAAAPAENVRRERPAPGDVIILLGGRTGRDGCGGATGSSKKHTLESLESCGAEVQKGNAPEERKLQRLFRNREASRMIRRCNDFGAGGVSVAIGELAEGLEINLDAVPKKYDGLDGTELAISESQERMAVAVDPADAPRFLELARQENLEATPVACVTEQKRLVMRWRGDVIVDLSREFLDTNGASRHIDVCCAAPACRPVEVSDDFCGQLRDLAGSLAACSRRGLSERFDSTIGAGTVLMPFGGVHQRTPIQAMVNKIASEQCMTDDCSVMSWAFDPYLSEQSPFHGAWCAVAESVCKLVAAGAEYKDVYLSFQEYFPKLSRDPKRWGLPLAALLGAFRAQKELGVAAIGGKDSMSGSFEQLDVPPTLVSFAVTTEKAANIVSPEFKAAGHDVVWLCAERGEDGLPVAASLLQVIDRVTALMRSGIVAAAWAPGFESPAAAVLKMSMGNEIGFAFDAACTPEMIFAPAIGSFILEVTEPVADALLLGRTTEDGALSHAGQAVSLGELLGDWEGKLEPVYPTVAAQQTTEAPALSFHRTETIAPCVKAARPLALIPVFPGTNCEYDTARALRAAGAEPEIIVINNLTAASIAESVTHVANRLRQAQIVFIPGGFSGGDEPEGSGKFITAFFRSAAVKDAVNELLGSRDGLMCGVCNGFQALIKLGLVPFGEIIDTDDTCPTLTFNTIGRHQSRIVRTRIASNKSPWLMETTPGEIYTVPISHGEGRFLCPDALLQKLAENGQIATQYADLSGLPTMEMPHNPNGSIWAVEGITSPDGRVFGKMGHSERVGDGLYKNVPGAYEMGMFRSAVAYFK